MRTIIDLSTVREEVTRYCESLLDSHAPYGCYRSRTGGRHDLYSSLDIAIMRFIMGENLSALPAQQRKEWIDHINSYADRYLQDGRYTDTYGHSPLHANGMVIGALGVLGGKQHYPVRLYDSFRDPERVAAWLEQIDWTNQWKASHLFWGGMLCYSFSSACSRDWLDAVFQWLDKQADEKTGWWRKGVPHADRHQPLGGSVHILPIYQHHHRPFPYPERLIDSVLALQLPSGRWLNTDSIHMMGYLELDALYALYYMRQLTPSYRAADIVNSVEKYAEAAAHYYKRHKDKLFSLHPHSVLAAAGTFGLLQKFLPERFPDDRNWSDIFSDRRLYQTKLVEVF